METRPKVRSRASCLIDLSPEEKLVAEGYANEFFRCARRARTRTYLNEEIEDLPPHLLIGYHPQNNDIHNDQVGENIVAQDGNSFSPYNMYIYIFY